MNPRILFAALLLGLDATAFSQTYNPPKIRITVKVVGEEGQPVSGADATLVFNEGPVGFGKVKEFPVVTDDRGNFTAEGYSETGTFGFMRRSIHKDGYDESGVNAGQSTK
jgi:hypothetical protein